MFTVQPCGGSVRICSHFSWSGLDIAKLCGQIISSAEYLNILNDHDHVFPSMIFFSFDGIFQAQDSPSSTCVKMGQEAHSFDT